MIPRVGSYVLYMGETWKVVDLDRNSLKPVRIEDRDSYRIWVRLGEIEPIGESR